MNEILGTLYLEWAAGYESFAGLDLNDLVHTHDTLVLVGSRIKAC